MAGAYRLLYRYLDSYTAIHRDTSDLMYRHPSAVVSARVSRARTSLITDVTLYTDHRHSTEYTRYVDVRGPLFEALTPLRLAPLGVGCVMSLSSLSHTRLVSCVSRRLFLSVRLRCGALVVVLVGGWT